MYQCQHQGHVTLFFTLFRARESYGFDSVPSRSMRAGGGANPTNKSFKYMRRTPTIVQYDTEELVEINGNNNSSNGGNGGKAEVHFGGHLDVVVTDSGNLRRRQFGIAETRSGVTSIVEDGPGKKLSLKKPLEVRMDGWL